MPAMVVTSGVAALDDLLDGGLLPGDNIIWLAPADGAYSPFRDAFLRASAGTHPTVFVAVSPAQCAASCLPASAG